MMLPGTPGAHIMIPINPSPRSRPSATSPPIRSTQATLPLPEDLRAGATVYTYDRATGARKVLRPGTNQVECMPRGADGFTWCYNKVGGAAPRHVGQAARREEDRPGDPAAMAEATKAGTITPTPFGTMSYRLYGKPDRIQLLWVLSVPGATPESIGVSTASQRDDALEVHGRAVADAAGHAGRAHHDPDQQVGPRRCAAAFVRHRSSTPVSSTRTAWRPSSRCSLSVAFGLVAALQLLAPDLGAMSPGSAGAACATPTRRASCSAGWRTRSSRSSTTPCPS